MENVKPCPYCGGEVEVVKLVPNKYDMKGEVYRIECRKCRALVARGTRFPVETVEEGKIRIKDYKEFIAKRMAPLSLQHVPQTAAAKKRDKKRNYGYSEN